jgi:hypothetical protein
VLLGGAAAYVTVADDPLAGEPHAIVPIELSSPPSPAPLPAPSPSAAAAAAAAEPPPSRTAAEVEDASGVAIMRPNGAAAPGSVIIRVPDADTGKLAPAPDPRLVERSRHGLLPKVGPDGAKPWQVYARPAGPAARAPVRIALLVTGLGISQSATAGAIAKLPPAVTLAFAPYGADIEKTVAGAREAGHEVMLQVPMEPFDYPDSDPGPHTLTTRAKPQENLDRLHWAMGRFAGYIGLVNFMGAKLTADEAALAPILKEIGSRGLVFLDDGSSSRSLSSAVGPSARAPTARADVVLDAAGQGEAVDRELARLEEMARKRGLAIGTASAFPSTIERILRWSRSLEAKGIALVPVSAAYPAEGR